MSLDAHDVPRQEKSRGLPDVCRKIKRATEFFQGAGIQTTASITASRLIDDYDKLPAFLESLGFKSCTFSYPLTTLGSTYLSFSQSKLVDYTPQELRCRRSGSRAKKPASRVRTRSSRAGGANSAIRCSTT